MLRSIIAAAAAIAAVSGFAHAGEFRFSYSAWELQSAEGRAAVFERINQNAEAVCIPENLRDPRAQRRAEACKSDVVAGVVDQIGDSRLAALSERSRYAAN